VSTRGTCALYRSFYVARDSVISQKEYLQATIPPAYTFFYRIFSVRVINLEIVRGSPRVRRCYSMVKFAVRQAVLVPVESLPRTSSRYEPFDRFFRLIPRPMGMIGLPSWM